MINDQIEMRGDVTVQLFDKDGNVKDTRKIKNCRLNRLQFNQLVFMQSCAC